MSHTTSSRRERIEAQGFLCLSDSEIHHLDYWFRVAPAVCLILVAVGVAPGSHVMLYSLIPFALLGTVMRTHPFDVLYNRVFRFYNLISPPMPTYGMPRRFACLVASSMIALTALAFHIGFGYLGYLLGSAVIIAALINVTTGFCVSSYVYHRLFGKMFEKSPLEEKHAVTKP